jgi:DNA-binding transcriptional ArsR family regulator
MSPAGAPNDVFRAVADPTRRRVLGLLRDGPAGFQDLHVHFAITKGGLSQHLSVLRRAGLVSVDDSDRHHRYRLTATPLREVADWVLPYARFWDERLTGLDRVLDDMAATGPTSPNAPDDPDDPDA